MEQPDNGIMYYREMLIVPDCQSTAEAPPSTVSNRVWTDLCILCSVFNFQRAALNFHGLALPQPTIHGLLLYLALLSIIPAVSQGQTNWEVTPYRIRLLVALDNNPQIEALKKRQIETDLRFLLGSRIGAIWSVEAECATGNLRRELLDRLPSLLTTDLQMDDSQISLQDKIIMLAIQGTDTGFIVTGREFDCRARQWGSITTSHAAYADGISEAAFRAAVDSFSPIAQVGRAESKKVVVQMRASALITMQPSPADLSEGAVLQPVVRRNDQLGNPRSGGTGPIPWTFLTAVKRVERGWECRIDTGLRNPLGSRSTARTERLALAVKPNLAATRLVLHSKQEPTHPLVDYHIMVRDPNSEESISLGRTEYDGGLDVPSVENLLRVIYVQSGSELIARLPIVPGLAERTIALIHDDGTRLRAEGTVATMKGQLVDLVVRREITAGRIRRAIKNGRLDDAERHLDALRALRSPDQFSIILNQEQQRIESADSRTHAKINNLFSETRRVLREYSDRSLVESLESEVKVAQQRGAAEPADANP